MNKRIARIILSAVRARVLQTHSSDSCIASVMVLREVLRIGFNITLQPRSVTATIYNPHVTKLLAGSDHLPTDHLAQAVLTPQGWSVGIGLGAQAASEPNKWAGHLVGISKHPWGILLWDPSLDQAARPAKNMNLTPLVEVVEHDPYDGPELRLLTNDCCLIYQAKPEMESILEVSPDWIKPERFQMHVRRVLSNLDALGIKMGDSK